MLSRRFFLAPARERRRLSSARRDGPACPCVLPYSPNCGREQYGFVYRAVRRRISAGQGATRQPSVFLNGDIAEKTTKIKQQEGPDLHVYGSANLVQTLLRHDLVNAFWLKIFPITLGGGKRLFAEGTIPAAFKVTESTVSYTAKDYPYWGETDGDLKAKVNNLPKAAANFFKAFDAKLEEGEEAHKALWEQLKNLSQIAEYAGRTKPTKEQARKAEEAMETIKEAHEKAERFVWWTTNVVDVSESLIEACGTELPRFSRLLEHIEKCNKGIEVLTGALGKGFWLVETTEKVGEIQDRYQSMQGALGSGAAATLALLPEVLGYVPFFGEVYKEAFKVVPGIVSMLENRNAQLQLAMAVGSR
jgi:RibD C-terminal domain